MSDVPFAEIKRLAANRMERDLGDQVKRYSEEWLAAPQSKIAPLCSPEDTQWRVMALCENSILKLIEDLRKPTPEERLDAIEQRLKGL
jgi:hypothetical protein